MQTALFHESFEDALQEVVRVCGGYKDVGRKLWPEKTVEAAAALLRNCLNDNRPERLTPDQVVLLLRMGHERGCHSAMDYIARESGYNAIAIEPEDEKARLQREFIEAAKVLDRINTQLGSLGSPAVRRVA